MNDFTPKIVAYCCEQSGMPAAAMALELGLTMPPGVELRPLPCAGRMETLFFLQSLEKGADGVIVFACHEENCQYLQGNILVKGRLAHARELLRRIGLEESRLNICNLATGSGVKFVEALREMEEKLKLLGPRKGVFI